MKSNNNIMLLIEVVGCLVLVILLSRSTVPNTVAMADIYAVYLRELAVFRFSTHSVFLIGNLIIIVVVVQSTKSAEKTTLVRKVQFAHHQYDITDQKIISSVPRHHLADEEMKARHQVYSRQNAEEFAGPQATIINMLPKQNGSVSEHSIIATEVSEKVIVKPDSSQLYRRTMSARYELAEAKVKGTVSKPELVRSKTVKCGTGETSKAVAVAGSFDEMNHDEFRRKIESFIEKQRRLIREELVAAGSNEHGFSRLRR